MNNNSGTKRISDFMGGLILGAGLFLASVVIFSIAYRAFDVLMKKFVLGFSDKGVQKSVVLKRTLDFSFESLKDVAVFSNQACGMEISDARASEGSKSLLIEFPPVRGYPGISFDLYDKSCLDWSKMEVFCFDAFNDTKVPATLIVQIRSGSQYPKKQFKKEIKLEPSRWVTVEIPKTELEHKLDLSLISHLTIFMSNPTTTFLVFIDNLIVKE